MRDTTLGATRRFATVTARIPDRAAPPPKSGPRYRRCELSQAEFDPSVTEAILGILSFPLRLTQGNKLQSVSTDKRKFPPLGTILKINECDALNPCPRNNRIMFLQNAARCCVSAVNAPGGNPSLRRDKAALRRVDDAINILNPVVAQTISQSQTAVLETWRYIQTRCREFVDPRSIGLPGPGVLWHNAIRAAAEALQNSISESDLTITKLTTARILAKVMQGIGANGNRADASKIYSVL